MQSGRVCVLTTRSAIWALVSGGSLGPRVLVPCHFKKLLQLGQTRSIFFFDSCSVQQHSHSCEYSNPAVFLGVGGLSYYATRASTCADDAKCNLGPRVGSDVNIR